MTAPVFVPGGGGSPGRWVFGEDGGVSVVPPGAPPGQVVPDSVGVLADLVEDVGELFLPSVVDELQDLADLVRMDPAGDFARLADGMLRPLSWVRAGVVALRALRKLKAARAAKEKSDGGSVGRVGAEDVEGGLHPHGGDPAGGGGGGGDADREEGRGP